MDPVGFEPTVFSLQRRRLPARPRARTIQGADERTRTSTPVKAIDPKSIASASSATSAKAPCRRAVIKRSGIIAKNSRLRKFGADLYPRFCQVFRFWRWYKYPSTRTVIYLSSVHFHDALFWQFVACWVLPSLTRTAATRSHNCVTLSPCSQLHARLARYIAIPAGRLLPHPFTPYRI